MEVLPGHLVQLDIRLNIITFSAWIASYKIKFCTATAALLKLR